MARPMPRLPPLTTTTFPSNSFAIGASPDLSLRALYIDLPAFPVTIRKKSSGGQREAGAIRLYKKARTLKEAVALLAKHKDDARLLAGGQSLIATLNMRLSAPALLIDINGINGLDGIAKKGGYVEIGALARHAQVERSELIAKHAPLIALAMPHIGHPAIRNRGTLRRLDRLRRSGGRIAGLPAGARRRDRHRPARRASAR